MFLRRRRLIATGSITKQTRRRVHQRLTDVRQIVPEVLIGFFLVVWRLRMLAVVVVVMQLMLQWPRQGARSLLRAIRK